MIGMDGERESGNYMLPAQFDDDDLRNLDRYYIDSLFIFLKIKKCYIKKYFKNVFSFIFNVSICHTFGLMWFAVQEVNLLWGSIKNCLDSFSIPFQCHLRHQAINPALNHFT